VVGVSIQLADGNKAWRRARVEDVDAENENLHLLLIDSGEEYTLSLNAINEGSLLELDEEFKNREVS
jgi:hypothetical protein